MQHDFSVLMFPQHGDLDVSIGGVVLAEDEEDASDKVKVAIADMKFVVKHQKVCRACRVKK